MISAATGFDLGKNPSRNNVTGRSQKSITAPSIGPFLRLGIGTLRGLTSAATSLEKQSGAAKRGSLDLSLHCDGNAADGRRHFGAHLRAAELQDDAVRILQLNAAGTAYNGTTRTACRVAACKVAGVVDV